MRRIAIDMDEVIADFAPKHLSVFNATYSENIQISELVGKHLRDLRPARREELLDLIREPSFFRDLAPIQDSQRVIQRLSESFEVFITTAAMEFPTSFNAKYEWLREHFPFISEMNYVFCGDKSVIRADYLIDDNVRHFERFVGKALLFSAPHNMNVVGYDRLSSWAEAEAYFLGSAGNPKID